MDRKTQWLCMVGGLVLFLLGVRLVYQKGDWVILILGGLILAFTLSSMFKDRRNKP